MENDTSARGRKIILGSQEAQHLWLFLERGTDLFRQTAKLPHVLLLPLPRKIQSRGGDSFTKPTSAEEKMQVFTLSQISAFSHNSQKLTLAY